MVCWGTARLLMILQHPQTGMSHLSKYAETLVQFSLISGSKKWSFAAVFWWQWDFFFFFFTNKRQETLAANVLCMHTIVMCKSASGCLHWTVSVYIHISKANQKDRHNAVSLPLKCAVTSRGTISWYDGATNTLSRSTSFDILFRWEVAD